MTKTLELILEKECDLQPGTNFHLLKVDGKKLTVEIDKPLPQLEEIVKAFELKEKHTPKRKMSEVLAGYTGGKK